MLYAGRVEGEWCTQDVLKASEQTMLRSIKAELKRQTILVDHMPECTVTTQGACTLG